MNPPAQTATTSEISTILTSSQTAKAPAVSLLATTKTSTKDYNVLPKLLSDIDSIFLGIIITIFVLTATLLGKAAKLRREKISEAEQKSKIEFDEGIASLKEKIKTSPKDMNALRKEIDNLEIKKKYVEDNIKAIDKKYNALGLKDSVFIPGGLFILSLLSGNLLILASENSIWKIISSSISLLFFIGGIYKVIITLIAVEDVSTSMDDEQPLLLQNALINALKTIEAEKEPRPYISFKDEKPPFIFKSNTENEIKYEINLQEPGNCEAKNVDVWFLTSTEIEIIKSGDSIPFKQSSSYTIPNANTIRYKFPSVKRHISTIGKLKIKTTAAGNFKIRYKVDCDNHSEPATSNKELGIIVQD